MQRFYTTVLAETPTMREIPLSSLARVVDCLEDLVEVLLSDQATHDRVAELIGRLFTSHDDLDAALVGAEDSLAGLADRFDLDDTSTGELKRLLVDYATRVAAELETGAARAFRALDRLRDRFDELASIAVENSDAQALIDRCALLASRGGRRGDWKGCEPGAIQRSAGRPGSPCASYGRCLGCMRICAGCMRRRYGDRSRACGDAGEGL